MLFIYFMRGYYELYAGVRIGIMVQLLFIFGPGAACNHHRAIAAKMSDLIYWLKLFSYLYYTVEPGVAAYTYIIGKTR